MIGGIKEYHIKKFSRLVKELEQLRKDIKCPYCGKYFDSIIIKPPKKEQ